MKVETTPVEGGKKGNWKERTKILQGLIDRLATSGDPVIREYGRTLLSNYNQLASLVEQTPNLSSEEILTREHDSGFSFGRFMPGDGRLIPGPGWEVDDQWAKRTEKQILSIETIASILGEPLNADTIEQRFAKRGQKFGQPEIIVPLDLWAEDPHVFTRIEARGAVLEEAKDPWTPALWIKREVGMGTRNYSLDRNAIFSFAVEVPFNVEVAYLETRRQVTDQLRSR